MADLASLSLSPPLLIVVFSGAVFRGLSGFGYALVTGPVLALMMSPSQSVPLIIAHEAFLTLVMLRNLKTEGTLPLLAPLVFGMVVGTPLGIIVLLSVGASLLTVLSAFAVLTFALCMLSLEKHLWRLSALKSLASGFVSGVINGCTGMSGPPAIIYLLGTDLDFHKRRAVFMVYFLACSIVASALLVIAGLFTWVTAIKAVVLFPAIAAGGYVGALLVRWFEPAKIHKFALFVLVLMSTISLVMFAQQYQIQDQALLPQ